MVPSRSRRKVCSRQRARNDSREAVMKAITLTTSNFAQVTHTRWSDGYAQINSHRYVTVAMRLRTVRTA